MTNVEQSILTLNRAHGLFTPGERVAVAVSGGADSMALLAALLALRDRLQIRLLAAHFHHGLRGAEADRDAAFVRDWCAAHGVECVVGRGDVRARAGARGESLEAAARALRYAFLESLPAEKIATAHTADDNTETVLIHLLRGTGTRGFAGIPLRRGRIVRPLLLCTHAQAEAYLTQNGLEHVEDSSNGADAFLRNRLRHSVLPLLRRENPAFSQTLTRSCAIVRAEDDYLAVCAAEAAANCRSGEGWSCSALLALPEVLRRRVLLSALQALPLTHPTERCVRQLESLLRAPCPSARLSLPEGFCARREYDRLVFSAPEAAGRCPVMPLKCPGLTQIPALGWQIQANVTENSNISAKNLTTFALRYDMIAAWSIRPRQSGDTLLLPGGHRSLKRLMIDRRVPAALRDRLPVVLCDGVPAAVLGLAVSEAFRARPGERALVLELLPLLPQNTSPAL